MKKKNREKILKKNIASKKINSVVPKYSKKIVKIKMASLEILTDTTATFIHSVPKSTDITAKEYTDGIHIAKMAIKAHNGDLDRGIISVKQEKIMKSGMIIFPSKCNVCFDFKKILSSFTQLQFSKTHLSCIFLSSPNELI